MQIDNKSSIISFLKQTDKLNPKKLIGRLWALNNLNIFTKEKFSRIIFPHQKTISGEKWSNVINIIYHTLWIK